MIFAIETYQYLHRELRIYGKEKWNASALNQVRHESRNNSINSLSNTFFGQCFLRAYYIFCKNNVGYSLLVPCVKSSHQRCSIKKGVPKNFVKFTGKHLCQSLFLNRVAGLSKMELVEIVNGFWRLFTVNYFRKTLHLR